MKLVYFPLFFIIIQSMKKNSILFSQIPPEILEPQSAFFYQTQEEDIQEQIDKLYDRNYKPSQDGQILSTKGCSKIINQKLQQMYENGFDFIRSENYGLAQAYSQNWVQVPLPPFYLRMNCPSCKQNQKKKKNRRWTSVCGTVSLQFKVVPIHIFNEKAHEHHKILIEEGIKFSTPFIIFHFLKVYKMACLRCHENGIPDIYPPFARLLADRLCTHISNYLNEIKSKNKDISRKRKMNSYHKSKLCEACKVGKCVSGKN